MAKPMHKPTYYGQDDKYSVFINAGFKERESTQKSEHRAIVSIAESALKLEQEAEAARSSNNVKEGQKVYLELTNSLIPKAEALLNSSCNQAFALFTLGLVCRIAGMIEKASICFEQSLHMHSGSINTLLELTLVMGMLNRNKEALNYAKRSIEIAPRSAAAWGNLAMSNIQCGNKLEALNAITKALELDPEDCKNKYIYDNLDAYFE